MTTVATIPQGTAVAVLDDQIAVQIRSAAPQFAPFLPKGVDVEQVVASVFLEAQRVPKLRECTPASILSAATKLVQWGFDIGRTGYLVPFGRDCTPVPSFKGLIELVLASGAARSCDAREVYEGDFFEFEYGSNARLRHVPGGLGKPQPRGRITHFYVVWTVKYGATKFDVMTLDEVEDLRLKYSKQWGEKVWRRGQCEPWYGIKTVIRRSAKQLPQNPKLAGFFAALQQDESDELGTPVLTARVAEADDRPTVPVQEAPVAGPAVTPGPADQDCASVKQVELIDRLSGSHHFNDKERDTLKRRIRTVGRAEAKALIDKALEFVEEKDREEREANKVANTDPLAGTADEELPF